MILIFLIEYNNNPIKMEKIEFILSNSFKIKYIIKNNLYIFKN